MSSLLITGATPLGRLIIRLRFIHTHLPVPEQDACHTLDNHRVGCAVFRDASDRYRFVYGVALWSEQGAYRTLGNHRAGCVVFRDASDRYTLSLDGVVSYSLKPPFSLAARLLDH